MTKAPRSVASSHPTFFIPVKITRFRVHDTIITMKSVEKIKDKISPCKLMRVDYGVYNIFPHNKIRGDGRLEINSDATRAYNLWAHAPTTITVKVTADCEIKEICVYGIIVDKHNRDNYAWLDETCFCTAEAADENEVYNYISTELDRRGQKIIKPFTSDKDKITVASTNPEECREIVSDWRLKIDQLINHVAWQKWEGSHESKEVKAEYGEREAYRKALEEYENEDENEKI